MKYIYYALISPILLPVIIVYGLITIVDWLIKGMIEDESVASFNHDYRNNLIVNYPSEP